MARRVCTTQPGDSACCVAAQRGLLGRPMTFTDRRGNQRCGQCDLGTSRSRDPRKAGKPIFIFRFHTNAMCNIGPRGCAALASLAPGGVPPMQGPIMPGPQGGPGGFLQLPGR